jgi:nitronate monooxygenase
MGGGVAGGELAGAVSAAGALGTVGMMAPPAFASALAQAHRRAPGRSVAANLLVPFIRRAHIQVCVEHDVSFVVLHGGMSSRWLGRLREQGVAVFVTVGTARAARRALAGGADGLVVQGSEAGGHLLGIEPLQDALPQVLGVAEGTPVLVAGGVADATDVQGLLDAGAAAAVAGTRFLLTDESAAHREYKRRVMAAQETLSTMLFGLGWPLRHRVIPNFATERWCHADELGPRIVRTANRLSAALGSALPL